MSAEAHTSLGVYKAWFEFDWEGGERDLRRALALNPSYGFAHDQLGLLLASLGRFDEAIAEGQRAIALDPLSPANLDDAAGVYGYAGKTAQALELTRRATELDPAYYFPVFQEGLFALYAEDYPGAIAKLERARALGAAPYITAYVAYAYGMAGDRARAMAALGELKSLSPRGEVAPFNMALVNLGLGDRARALDYLEQAYATNSQQVFWLNVDPIWKPLRSELRFQSLLRRLNFPT